MTDGLARLHNEAKGALCKHNGESRGIEQIFFAKFTKKGEVYVKLEG